MPILMMPISPRWPVTEALGSIETQGSPRPTWHAWAILGGAALCVACLGFLATGTLAITAGTIVALAGSSATAGMLGIMAGIASAIATVFLVNKSSNRRHG